MAPKKTFGSRLRLDQMTAVPPPPKNPRDGSISPAAWWALLSFAVVVLLAYLALLQQPDGAARKRQFGSCACYCAAGVNEPIVQALYDYRQRCGQRAVVARADGSGRLYGQITAEAALGSKRGADLFVTADATLLQDGFARGVIGQRFALAIERPVIAAAADSDFAAGDLADLLTVDRRLRIGIANQDAAIGKITRQIAERLGVVPDYLDRCKVETENVMQLAQALVTKSLDAAVLWDTTVTQINRQHGRPLLRVVAPAENNPHPCVGHVAVGVVRNSSDPEAALRLARFLSSSEGGLQRLAEAGFEIVEQKPQESSSLP